MKLGGRPALIAGLLAVQALVVGLRCRASCLFLDDFLNFELYNDSGLRWSYLTRDVFGQVAPGYRFTQAVYFKLFGASYVPALVILTAMSLMITVFLVLIAERAGIDRWLIAAAAIVQAFLLQFMHAQLWWATALHMIPSLMFIMAALFCLVGPAGRGPTSRGRILAAVCYAAALSFTAKALFSPLMIAGVLFHLRLRDGRGWRDSLRGTLADVTAFIPVAMIYALLVLKYGPKDSPPPPTLLVGIQFVWRAIVDGILTTTLGLGTTPPPLPRDLAVAIAVAATATAAIWSIRRNRSVALVWAGFLLYEIVAFGVVARMRGFAGADTGASLRYHCEGATFLILTLLLSTGGRPFGQRARQGAVALAVLIAAALQLESKHVYHDWDVAHTCVYIDNLKTDLKPLEHRPDAILLDATVPGEIMIEWTTPYNVMSSFLPLFTRLPVMGPDRATYEVTRNGHVRHR
jgi:hypothetical protein